MQSSAKVHVLHPVKSAEKQLLADGRDDEGLPLQPGRLYFLYDAKKGFALGQRDGRLAWFTGRDWLDSEDDEPFRPDHTETAARLQWTAKRALICVDGVAA